MFFMKPEVSVRNGLPVTQLRIYVVRYFIEKKRGGKGGEQCSMADQSGDGDQSSTGLQEEGYAPPTSLHCMDSNLQPFLVFPLPK